MVKINFLDFTRNPHNSPDDKYYYYLVHLLFDNFSFDIHCMGFKFNFHYLFQEIAKNVELHSGYYVGILKNCCA